MSTLGDFLSYGLRMIAGDTVVDSKSAVLNELKEFVADQRERTLPPDWWCLAPSLQNWWLQEQRVLYLQERLASCKAGMDSFQFWVDNINQRIDAYNAWFDARYELEYYGGPPPPEALQESRVFMLARASELDRESANFKMRRRQAQILQSLLTEEETKLKALQQKISKAEMDMRREDNRARRAAKRDLAAFLASDPVKVDRDCRVVFLA